MLFKFFKNQDTDSINRLYLSTVEQARHQYFYQVLTVPDSIDGRFDLIVLHVVVILNRLKDGNYQVALFAKRFLNYFFLDMDRNLRELGVSDLSVPKKMKKMAEAFYGRQVAYSTPLLNNDLDALTLAIDRNIFPGQDVNSQTKFLARYLFTATRKLAEQSTKDLLLGKVSWPNPEQIEEVKPA